MTPKRNYTAQRGIFSHDDDPESWEFRATTRVNLGLLDKTYPMDDVPGSSHSQDDSAQWQRFQQRFQQHLRELNANDKNKQYKLLYLVRHGEGVHNVKEKEVGRTEWDRYWAKVAGDGTVTWADAELTANGEQQACNIVEQKKKGRQSKRSCANDLVFIHAIKEAVDPGIAENYPSIHIEAGLSEEDVLWSPDRRETLEEHSARNMELLDDIFEGDYRDYIVLAAHSGAIMSLFAATGWKKVPVAAGAVYPLLVCGEKLETV
ncbi:hypothetical protein BU25DRAFT_466366 [Macroventuria anomochaeta]|uniref:Uncharacterized protein n=1 Tax=Macroventuria anomochaeta TaxID=301207 RepID=A0ACB6S301_9PLEO|nr:uncharacterized protein BU25DRAFT_466366 [Macroventuria anomochaeta]KAF2628620.1 hypothetical protein BU25DRAFT_466366 [Macroventuria anomochaeta]